MKREYHMFYSRLEIISEKNDLAQSISSNRAQGGMLK